MLNIDGLEMVEGFDAKTNVIIENPRVQLRRRARCRKCKNKIAFTIEYSRNSIAVKPSSLTLLKTSTVYLTDQLSKSKIESNAESQGSQMEQMFDLDTMQQENRYIFKSIDREFIGEMGAVIERASNDK